MGHDSASGGVHCVDGDAGGDTGAGETVVSLSGVYSGV